MVINLTLPLQILNLVFFIIVIKKSFIGLGLDSFKEHEKIINSLKEDFSLQENALAQVVRLKEKEEGSLVEMSDLRGFYKQTEERLALEQSFFPDFEKKIDVEKNGFTPSEVEKIVKRLI